MDMRAKKENKVYRITTEAEKTRYLKEGFDIYNDKGEIVEHSPLKKIAYGEYDKLAKEKAALEAENAELQKQIEELKAAAEAKPEKAKAKASK